MLAYDKDPITGIVSHLDDQCIGCSYCIFTCPYEVPKFSSSRGIVRKCDLCQGRLHAKSIERRAIAIHINRLRQRAGLRRLPHAHE